MIISQKWDTLCRGTQSNSQTLISHRLISFLYIKIFSHTHICGAGFFQKFLFLDSTFSKNLGRFDIFWNYLYNNSNKSLQIWNPHDLSFHLTPCLPSLRKIDWKSETRRLQAKKISVGGGKKILRNTKVGWSLVTSW